LVVKELLLQLLLRLEAIGEQHEEIGDTVCREAMRSAVFRSFLRPEPGYDLPEDYGLMDPEANRAVGEAIADYVSAARALVPSLGLTNFQQRLTVFQDASVFTEDGSTYDEYFGYQSPERYDTDGKWLGPT
jgi:hypothetical protein